MLSRFNIIVAVDDKYGIGKNGCIPWRNAEDFAHFRNKTIGDGDNVVIMGRKTYESLPPKMRPLPKRKNIVLTTQKIEGVTTCTSILEALKLCNTYKEVYIIGGQRVYEECINTFSYLCDKIFVSHISGDYQCDTFFPYRELTKLKTETNDVPFPTFSLEIITVKEIHPEQQYLDLLSKIMNQGEVHTDRTNVGTKSIFAPRMEFDLRKGFPLLTTKTTWFKGILAELLLFISGNTDTKELERQGVNIWKANTSAKYLHDYNLPWREGDIGPSYSFQWRHAGAKYLGCDKDYTGQGVDQLQNLITDIKKDPFGRRHIISAWDAANIHLMALPPCHCFVQFYVGCDSEGIPTYLDCCLYQRSSDMFLGIPFNIASYSLFMCIIGKLTNLIPRRFVHDLGDAHIYSTHIEQVNEQIKRSPYPFPRIRFIREIKDIDDIRFEDIVLEDYISHPKLSAEMAI